MNSEDLGSNKKPFVTVGKLLENLCKNASVAQHYLCSRKVLPCDTATVSVSIELRVYSVPACTQITIISIP